MAVLFNAINSFLFFRQQPPGRFWAAAALGLAGIVILFWDDLLANGLNASLLCALRTECAAGGYQPGEGQRKTHDHPCIKGILGIYNKYTTTVSGN